VLKIKNVSWSAAFVFLLTACSPQEFPPTGSSFVDNFRVLAGDWDVEAVKSLPRPEGEFEAALFDEYIRLGAAPVETAHTGSDADRFARYAG
jgi:hypothetical protein